MHPYCAHMQALVVSTPAGIGAGHVIEAAEEAEGQLQHGKPIPLHMPPKVCCHVTVLQQPLDMHRAR